jgi:hypothetical protein
MKTSEEYLMDLWRRTCDYDLHHENRGKMPTYSVLKKSEWSEEFERGMRYRLIIGAFRYGRLREPNKPQYDRVSDIKNRIVRYEKDGNLEHLIDIANICLCEFVEGDHPKRHFKSQDDAEHTK